MSKGLLIAILVVVWALANLLGEIGRPMMWLFPEGFVGSVIVEFKNPSCQPLPTEGIFLVVRLNEEGRACTSDVRPKGWVYNRYQYVSPRGERREIDPGSMIWQEFVSADRRYNEFFVGTQSQLEANREARPLPP